MAKKYNVAIVGATGAVGEVMMNVLAERKFPVDQLYLLASDRSAGNRVNWCGRELTIQNLAEFDFARADIGLFSAGASISAEYAPMAAAKDCIVVDNTSQFRYDDDIPLVIPEVNPQSIAQYTQRGIIANPNCSTIQMLVATKPLYDAAGIRRINVATYQAVSGTGKEAIDELMTQTRAILRGESVNCDVYPKQIAFNALPHIDIFLENGYTKEEMKMVWETQKILGDSSVLVNPTTVRVPVVYGHSEAVHLELGRPVSTAEARELLHRAPGVIVMDERVNGGYPTAVGDVAGRDEVFVGRIREDISHPNGLNLWVVGDNLRKGAATNSVQIAEFLIENHI